MSGSLKIIKRIASLSLWGLLMVGGLSTSFAAPIQNSATGSLRGIFLNLTNSTVNLNRVSGSAATSAVSEISPQTTGVSSVANVFIYDVLPTINGVDSGVDQIQVVIPSGFNNFSLSSVTVGGFLQPLSCPNPAAGESCGTFSGQILTVNLGTKVTTSLTNIQLTLMGDSPGVPGSGNFSAMLNDTTTVGSPVMAVPGNADADSSDANSITVQALGEGVTSAVAEVSPNTAVLNSTGNIFSFDILPIIQTGNTGIDQLIVTVPGAISNLGGTNVSVGGVGQTLNCPTPGPGQYCATISGQVITIGLGTKVTSSLVSIQVNFSGDISSTPGSGNFSGTVNDSQNALFPPQVLTVGNADGDAVDQNSLTIYFTQGVILDLKKVANKKQAVVGDVVTYWVELKNPTSNDVTQVQLEDQIPPNFTYRNGSTLINGAIANDPTGNKTLVFNLGTLPAFIDGNGNGIVESGEPGYVSLSYQLIVNSGATPKAYFNRAIAKDVCGSCPISNQGEAKVTVTLDPIFDLGTIIGKVFEDKDQNGWQDRGELGIGGAMIALDNGTYALTDEHGRYHFPAVLPGQRLLKINLQTLPAGSIATTRATQVVTVTPGLLAKANFGVSSGKTESEFIGKPGERGFLIQESEREQVPEVLGNLNPLTILVNGQEISLPKGDVQMGAKNLEEEVNLKGSNLEQPVEFKVEVDRTHGVDSWRLMIMDRLGQVIRTLEAKGQPSKVVRWDGRTDQGELIQGGDIYQYQMIFEFSDGSRLTSARRMFGVNKTSAIAINLTGGAFRFNSHELSPEAKNILKKLAMKIRNHPNEKIYVEGHADSEGSEEYNLELSQKRAEAALEYLINEEKISKDRFVVRGFGESKPIAFNETEAGRELNRRVEIKGQVYEVEKHKLFDQFRAEPVVRINQSQVPVDSQGRFFKGIPEGGEGDQVEIEVVNSQGRSIQTTVSLPKLEILAPTGEVFVPYPPNRNLDLVQPVPMVPTGDSPQPDLVYQFVGRTDPNNAVELNGKPLNVNPQGFFSVNLNLKVGINRFGLLILNPKGLSRISNLTVNLMERDAEGNPILVIDPIPNLSVQLPPKGVPLKSKRLTLNGKTDPGNIIHVNDQEVEVRTNGGFSTTLTLPEGKSLIQVRVTDPEGHVGMIEREVDLSKTRLFFLAFVDGEFGQMRTKGNLNEAGVESDREFYQEGRLAYYLKGVIAGKYLITSAFDTGRKEFKRLFKDLDEVENEHFLTNLDPDKLYPVYGDASTIVYDAESQGKFYLAVDSEEFHLLVGNYSLNLGDTELANYQRTFYGSRFEYQSASRTEFGQPDTKIALFGAEVHETHIRDELQATGGSLYYLSHREIVEGSDQVTLVVRDKNTGVVLYRVTQQQNFDYTIKYEEGRILFHRPISSVVEDGSLFDQNLLSGNPVFIQVDYEARLNSFEKTASGGRVRRQLGDHLAVGGTYVKDELDFDEYELKGVDMEIHLSKNTKIIAEAAETSGTDSRSFRSDDGGLTFQESTPNGFQGGKAWKIATEVDVGEWFGSPDRIQIGGYFKKLDQGFLSSGNFLEQGTTKTGVHFRLKLTDQDKVLGRYDRQEFSGSSPSALTGMGEIDESTLQWIHDRGWWGITGEYHGRKSMNNQGATMEDSHYGTTRLRLEATQQLNTWVEHQQTLSGFKNDQTTLGVDYQVLPTLTLNASGTHGTLGNAAEGGALLKLGEGQIYLTERFTEDQVGKATSTVLGGETAIGSSTKIYSEYQWEKRKGEDRTLSVLGAQREWDLGRGFRLVLSGEHSEINSSNSNSRRYTVALGLGYTHPKGLTVKTHNEVRREWGSFDRVQFLTVNLFELKLNQDFTLLGKFKYSVTRDIDQNKNEAEFDERSVGLAYRPVAHDRFNALARYTWLTDQGPQSLPDTVFFDTKTEVASVEWSYDINRFLEWVEKDAIKIKREQIEGRPLAKTHTYLSIHRLNIRVWKGIAVGNEYRMLRQQEADDQKQGWLSEVTWEAVQHLRLGVGFNFTDFSDNEFSDNDYSVYGWFIRVQGTF